MSEPLSELDLRFIENRPGLVYQRAAAEIRQLRRELARLIDTGKATVELVDEYDENELLTLDNDRTPPSAIGAQVDLLRAAVADAERTGTMPTMRKLSAEEIEKITRDCIAAGGTVHYGPGCRPDTSGVPHDTPEPKAKRAKKDGAKLVPASFTPPGTWMIPVRCFCGDNDHRFARARIGRSGRERWTVHRTMAKNYHALTPFVKAMHSGKRVKIKLTRYGPRAMDRMNAIASLKYIQDAVADRFGVDDGDFRFDWEYDSQLGPLWGVKIEVSLND